MASDWVTRKIGSLGRVVTGKTPSTSDTANFDGPYPFITIPDLDGRVAIDRAHRTLSEKGAKIIRSCRLPPGAVMMSCIATVGKCGVTAKPSFTNQQINSVIPTEGTDARFLYYVFTQLGHQLQSAGGGGSVYTNVSKSRFADIEVELPEDVTEQRAIAHILGTLDNKIEINRRMNQTLEAMAQAIFKSWFVDFDPVRAKMEGRKPYGMDAETAALFPDGFEESELGPVPRGWRVDQLGYIAENRKDGVHPSEIAPSTPYIGLDHIPRRNIALSVWSNAGEVGSNKSRFYKGDILFGKLRPYFHKVGIAAIDGVCSTDILVIAPVGDKWFSLALGYVSSAEFVNYTDATSTGTKMPRTNWRDMSRYPVVIPSADVLKAYNKIVVSIKNKIDANIHGSRTLAALRDTLLTKLLSGEVRVKEVEKVVEGGL